MPRARIHRRTNVQTLKDEASGDSEKCGSDENEVNNNRTSLASKLSLRKKCFHAQKAAAAEMNTRNPTQKSNCSMKDKISGRLLKRNTKTMVDTPIQEVGKRRKADSTKVVHKNQRGSDAPQKVHDNNKKKTGQSEAKRGTRLKVEQQKRTSVSEEKSMIKKKSRKSTEMMLSEIESCDKEKSGQQQKQKNTVPLLPANEKKKSQINSDETASNFVEEVRSSEPVDRCNSSSSESEWEDVEELPFVDPGVLPALPGTEVKPRLPERTVQITLEAPIDYENRKRKKGNYDMKEAFRLLLNRFRKQSQENVHKVHLMCLISYAQSRNFVCCNDLLMGLLLSVTPYEFVSKTSDTWRLSTLKSFVEWFQQAVVIDRNIPDCDSNLCVRLQSRLNAMKVCSDHEHVLLFVLSCRAIGLHTRLVHSLRPVTFKANDLIPKSTAKRQKRSESDNGSQTASEVDFQIEELKLEPGSKEAKSEPEPEHKEVKLMRKKNSAKKSDTKPCGSHRKSSRESAALDENSETEVGMGVIADANVGKRTQRRSCTAKKIQYAEDAPSDGDISGSEEKRATRKNDQNTIEKAKKVSFGSSSRKSTSKGMKRKFIESQNESSDEDYVPADCDEDEKPAYRVSSSVGRKSSKQCRCSKPKPEKIQKQIPSDLDSESYESDELSESLEELESENDFEEKKPPARRRSANVSRKSCQKKTRKHQSDSDRFLTKIDTSGSDWWAEVFIDTETRWIVVNSARGIVDKLGCIELATSQPMSHVLAFDADGTIKDISKKYISDWSACINKLRIDESWWQKLLEPYQPPSECHKNAVEDQHIQEKLSKKPLPATVGEYKNHPMYALQRHLLKFEAIYPPTAAPLGFIRGEPVYARECVHTLHAREKWVHEGRVVRVGEEPYKIVKARPKWNKPKEFNDQLKLNLYGHWQTEDYVPPPVIDGKIPVNEYGNVEVFKPWMLPSGAVHLKDMPGLNKVARKLEIDCFQAMVGWDFHGGHNHPVFDGWVVCEEHVEVLVAAWEEEQEIIRKKEAEKREQRVYENWRRLIRGLLIKQRIKSKFEVEEPHSSQTNCPPTSGKSKGKGPQGRAVKLVSEDVKDELKNMDTTDSKVLDSTLFWPQNRQKEGKQTKKENPLPFEK